MYASTRTWCFLVLASLILAGRADDSEEFESSEEDVLPPVSGLNCPRYCLPYPSSSRQVCGTNGITYASYCHLRLHACSYRANWGVAYAGACIVIRPPVTFWPPTTRRIPITRRPTTVRITQAPTTTPTVSTTTSPTTTIPTTEQVTCPATCDLVFEPVCTTVGTYQSECAFNAVRCRGIISQSEMILYVGYCLDATTSGP